MMLKETIRKIVRSQKKIIKERSGGIKREEIDKIKLNLPYATIISGVRRCGKSTLLKQLMNKTKKYYYFNFEDPRISPFELEDFQRLDEVFKEEYGECKHYFFDEVQNIEGWEKFVRQKLDEGKNFFITGSNASLLSKELGTKLTGRHLQYELYPFSFQEMMEITQKKPSINSFEEYLQKGGFPEYLEYKKTEILQELLRDVVIRDIAVRHKLREIKTINEMAVYLLTNVGKEFSYNKLTKLFRLGSTNTITSFISYLEDSYLVFTIPKFDYSLKKQLMNPKKVYSIDNGLSKENSSSFSEDRGRMLENIVFIQLKRLKNQVFYFKKEGECDFIVKKGKKIVQAIQVCYELNETNKKRELNGLIEAMAKTEKGLLLTYNQEDKIKIKGKEIIIKPVWKWLLEYG